MNLVLPEGRPSRFLRDLEVVGEAPAGAPRPDHDEALALAQARRPPLDIAALRARAAGLAADPALDRPPGLPQALAAAETPVPAANRSMGWLLGLLVAAALVTLGLKVGADLLVKAPGETPDITIKGEPTLRAFRLDGGVLVPYDQEAVGEGDVLGFRVSADLDGVVVLSVDGGGSVSVFWPEVGDAPQPLDGSADVGLPGTVILDDAPGPELFVAVFDREVSAAKALVAQTWTQGGAEAVKGLDAQRDIDVVEVLRR